MTNKTKALVIKGKTLCVKTPNPFLKFTPHINGWLVGSSLKSH